MALKFIIIVIFFPVAADVADAPELLSEWLLVEIDFALLRFSFILTTMAILINTEAL